MDRNLLFDKLTTLLGESGREAIYPCIGDLVVNGLQVSRFAPSDHVPNRQDVTQYLAAWCRNARVSEEACQTWLSDYAVSTLAAVSKSSPAGIRHSTKSNVKYTYRSERPFVCALEGNKFRAECSKACRVYDEMVIRAAATAADSLTALSHPPPAPPSVIFVPAVKDVYREQFQAARQLVSSELAKGTKKSAIRDLLEQQGMKTRTGRAWTYPILVAEIRKLEAGGQSHNLSFQHKLEE